MAAYPDSNVSYELIPVHNGHDSDEDIIDGLTRQTARNKASYADTLLMHLCCVSRTPSNYQRSPVCNCCINCLNISFVITLLGLGAFGSWVMWAEPDAGETIVYIVMSIIFMSTMVIPRILVIVYFNFYMHYPWHSRLQIDRDIFAKLGQSKCSKNMYKSVIIFTLLMELASMIALSFPYDAGSIVGVFFFYVFIMIPNYTPLLVQAAIIYKHQSYLSLLIENVGSDDVDVYDMFNWYKRVCCEFKKDYHVLLRITTHISFAGVFVFLWIVAADILTGDTADIMPEIVWIMLHALGVLVCYVMTGCYLNETLEALQHKLWKQVEAHMARKHDSTALSLFIAYIINHPVSVSFAGVTITRRSTSIFLLGFLVSRAVSMAMYYLYF